MGKTLTMLLTATAVLLLGATLAVAEDCDSTKVWDRISEVCRLKCCTDETDAGKTNCSDDEVCWHGSYCLDKAEAARRQAAASAATAKKAEEEKKSAEEAAKKAEEEKKSAEEAAKKAEEEKKSAEEAAKKAEADKAAAEKKATEEAAARVLAEAQAKASAEVAEKAKKKALASEKTGHILLSLDTSLVVGGIPKEYDGGLVLPRFVLEGGWLFHPDGWWSFFLEGAMGGAKIPPLDDSKAWIVGVGGGAWLSPANFFHFAFSLWYLGEIPQYREDGPPDSMGEVRIGVGFKVKNRFSIDGYWGGTFGDEEMEVLVSRLGLVLTGHW
jgi:hypothetical protein